MRVSPPRSKTRPVNWMRPLRNRTNTSDIEFLPEPALHSPKFTTRQYNHSRSSSFESISEPVLEICSPPGLPPTSFMKAREQAAETLETCRSVLLSLEMTRMTKARIGRRNWMIFWHRIYDPSLARALCEEVDRTFPEIDKTFRLAATHLCNLTFTVARCLNAATSEEEVFSILEEMERVTISRREMRRERVIDLLIRLRSRIESIPVDVSDELFDDLKRGVFALDIRGDYHPGDPDAEECDRQIDQPLEASDYVEADPDLPLRPGFRAEFRDAILRATGQENIRPVPLDGMEEWVNTEYPDENIQA